jgi:DtxR family Mn-dependent transcriptional regulator
VSQTLTSSTRNYLKHIYELTKNGGSASTNALAEKLKVRPASVTVMVQKLVRSIPPLVEYHKHQGVSLTEDGLKAALEVIRHHRLLETWLVRSLDYSWDEVHAEAERLEHVISEDFERRIAGVMGNPLRDPHGELIPTADLTMPRDDSSPLSALRPDQAATIRSIRGADPTMLRHLKKLGLVPGVHIQVEAWSPIDQNLTVRVGSTTSVLGYNITERILVKVS